MRVFSVKHVARLLVLLLLALFSGTVFAQQNDTPPLLHVLEFVPDDVASTESFSYIDYRAVAQARSGTPTVTTAEDWLALTDDDSPERALWFAATRGISSGPVALLQYAYGQPLEARASTGFDPYAVERAVAYGEPPGEVTLLIGDFDEAQIATAHTLRDYVQTTVEGLTLWCGNEECDGMQMDLASRSPANPFGGALGRRQAVLASDSLVASSASTARLTLIAEVTAGNTTSLAENPDYRAAAEAISQDGLLLQMWFINPSMIASFSESAILGNIGSTESPSQIATLQAQLLEEFIPIPQYNLIAFADTATESEQIALIALVYNSADNAQAAGEVLLERIETYVSLVTDAPFRQIMEDRGLTSLDTEVYEGDERAVLLLRLRGTLAPAEPEDSSDPIMSSSMIFQLLTRMYLQRDIGWLATLP